LIGRIVGRLMKQFAHFGNQMAVLAADLLILAVKLKVFHQMAD
jgi:hypothetical protein